MMTVKYFGMSPLNNRAISTVIQKNEKHVRKIAKDSRNIISKIKFKNFHKLALMTADFVKKESIALKRKFDSQQPKFLLKLERPDEKQGHSVSFFLKRVSEHKESLKRKKL